MDLRFREINKSSLEIIASEYDEKQLAEFSDFLKTIEPEWKSFQILKETGIIKDMNFRKFLAGGKTRNKLHLDKK